MNKPHVDKLHYRMIIPETVDYDEAPPVTADTDLFSMTASVDGVTFTMKEHFETETDARTVTDKYLDEWTVLIGLRSGPEEIKFRFNRAEVIDLEPPTDGKIMPSRLVGAIPCPNAQFTMHHASHPKYPDPPDGFTVSPNVETMYLRYKAYREGRDRLLSMAYLILTVTEMNAGSRGKAGRTI